MIYQNELRHAIHELGFKTYDRPFDDGKGVSFGIAGLNLEVREKFSKRHNEIMENIHSEMSGAQVRAEVLKCRKDKKIDRATLDLRAGWRSEVPNYKEPLRYDLEKAPKCNEKDFLREVATNLQIKTISSPVSSEAKTVSKNQIVHTICSKSKGTLTSEEALERAESFVSRYTTNKKQDKFILNERGKNLVRYETILEKATRFAKEAYYWHRQKRNKVKQAARDRKIRHRNKRLVFQYATGKITRKQYLYLTNQEKPSSSIVYNRTLQALGIISKKQATLNINLEKLESGDVVTARILQTLGVISKRQADYFINKAKWEAEQKEREELIKARNRKEKQYVAERRECRRKSKEYGLER